jgi:hypothetical protein
VSSSRQAAGYLAAAGLICGIELGGPARMVLVEAVVIVLSGMLLALVFA